MFHDLTMFAPYDVEISATSDAALRALLGEFMDDGVVAGVQTPVQTSGQPDVLWIPAPKEMLRRILRTLGMCRRGWT